MPTIILQKRKARDVTLNDKAKQVFYQDRRWKRIRNLKFRNNPLCERCLAKVPQVVRPTEEVHHIIPIDIEHPNEDLIFDYDNLQSLCLQCHKDIHYPANGMNPIEAQIIQRREVR